MRYALVALLLFGCSEEKREPGAFVCESRIQCPNQREAAPLDECNDAAFEPTCGASYRAYFECFSRNHVCDGRGQLDPDASAARCSKQLEEWTVCTSGDTGAPVDTAIEDTLVEDTFVEDTSTEDATTAD